MEIAVGSRPGTPQFEGTEAYVAEIVGPGTVLLAVAHGFGRVRERSAPETAVHALRDALRRRSTDAQTALRDAFSVANARVFGHSGSSEDHIACSVSMTAALVVGDRAWLAHVGGTRADLARAGELTTLTTEDAIGVGAGRLLLHALGTGSTLDVPVHAVPLQPGDAMVLSSGRIHDLLDADEIVEALAACSSSQDVTARLLAIAGIRGEGAGTVIVGRALTERAEPKPTRKRPPIGEALVLLAAMLAASAVAFVMLHGLATGN
jgi:protein phosphatase